MSHSDLSRPTLDSNTSNSSNVSFAGSLSSTPCSRLTKVATHESIEAATEFAMWSDEWLVQPPPSTQPASSLPTSVSLPDRQVPWPAVSPPSGSVESPSAHPPISYELQPAECDQLFVDQLIESGDTHADLADLERYLFGEEQQQCAASTSQAVSSSFSSSDTFEASMSSTYHELTSDCYAAYPYDGNIANPPAFMQHSMYYGDYVNLDSPPSTQCDAPGPQKRPRQSASPSHPSPGPESPSDYRTRRDKNNAASAKSRAKRAAKVREMGEEKVRLERRNDQLRAEETVLAREVEQYKQMLLSMRG